MGERYDHSKKGSVGHTRRIALNLLILLIGGSLLSACTSSLSDSERRALCAVPSVAPSAVPSVVSQGTEPSAGRSVIVARETRNWGNLMAQVNGAALRRNEACVDAPKPN